LKPSILALVVVYGIPPTESPAVSSIRNSAKTGVNLRTLIWDNSLQRIQDDLPEVGWGDMAWVHTPENLGMAAIYNAVISDRLRQHEHLLLLDQDTRLPENFFEVAALAIVQNPSVALFLPMVRAHARWVSPLYAALGWGRYWRQPQAGLLSSRHLGAINSGMIIAASYLQKQFVGYNRNLRFYGTDTYFMLEYRRQNKWAFILDTIIDHDLSFFSTSTEGKVVKFREMRYANAICYSRSAWPVRLGVCLLMACAALIYAYRYKNLGFLVPK
jgi:GT2 family glycosyltransferase